MNDSNRDNTVAGGGVVNDVGGGLLLDADMAMFSKITRNNGEKRGGRGRGCGNNSTIGVDGATYDLSNLSTELTTKTSLDAAASSSDKNPSKVLEKKRPERRMMKLYPTKGSVRLKAPSIRNIDSCFTESPESSEPPPSEGGLGRRANNRIANNDYGHNYGSPYHQREPEPSPRNSSFPSTQTNNDGMTNQSRQEGQYYGGSCQYNNTNNNDNPTSRCHRTGDGPAPTGNQYQGMDHLRKQAPVNVHNFYDTNMSSGQHRYDDQRSMNRHCHQQQNQSSSVPSSNNDHNFHHMNTRSSQPSAPPSREPGRLGQQQEHRGGMEHQNLQKDTSTTALSPEEEARRMMEERFKKKDDPVSQLYTQLARKPDARPASFAVSSSPSANDPPSSMQDHLPRPTRNSNKNPAVKSRRESLIRNYSSKLNLKPSAEPSYETFEIEVSPGVHLPMRGAEETEQAMKEGRIREMQCFCCETRLCCIITAEFIYCPVCSVIGPIEYPSNGAHGVGLGLTQEAVDEIVSGTGTWTPPSILSNH